MVEFKNSSSNFPELEKCCGEFFSELEKELLFPILVGWAGSDLSAAHWLKNCYIPAFGGKTGLEMCCNNQPNAFVHYVRHLEQGGFA